MDKIRIGIIGCGEVTQIMHLPSLAQLQHLFQVTAICDVSRQVLDGVGDRWNIANRYLDYRDLVAREDIDAVLIASPHVNHVQNVLAALAAGKHILVEKPMCFTLEETDEIIAAQRKAGVTVQVGYIRRYVPAFEQACQVVRTFSSVTLARVRDIIGRNSLIVEKTSKVIRGNDIAPQLLEANKKLQVEMINRALGKVPPELEKTYLLLLGLGSHDVSAMREILGMPDSVLYAAQRQQGGYITAAFDYGDFVCHLEIGIDNIPRFSTDIQVYSPEKVVQVRFSTPYIRNLPQQLVITETDGSGSTSDSTVHPQWGDPFVAEWEAFYHNVTQRRTPKTDPQDYRYDLQLFLEMMDYIKAV